MSEEVPILFRASEPFFAGHFPGEPLVPGVVILERVVEEISRRAGVKRWPQHFDAVKFLAPLRPGDAMTIELEALDAARVRFRCHSGKTAVATGRVTLRVGAESG